MTLATSLLFFLSLASVFYVASKVVRLWLRYRLRRAFAEAALAAGLNIVEESSFPNRMIGLDVANQKLLYIIRHEGYIQTTVIHLENVTGCRLRKLYLKAPYRNKSNQLRLMVDRIVLEIERSQGPVAELMLYQLRTDGQRQCSAAESLSGKWEKRIQEITHTIPTNSAPGML
jgi:hypothetical protein